MYGYWQNRKHPFISIKGGNEVFSIIEEVIDTTNKGWEVYKSVHILPKFEKVGR